MMYNEKWKQFKHKGAHMHASISHFGLFSPLTEKYFVYYFGKTKVKEVEIEVIKL